MKYLIVANWKMNPSTEKEAEELFDKVKNGVEGCHVEVVVCPPFVYLPLLKGLTLGAQNVFYKESGAFTGEVSSLMLKDLHVQYVILGHSESRKYLNETDEIINKKIKECLSENLTPIFCVGEKEGENKEEVLERQIKEGLKEVSQEELKNLVIAYEPVSAIGNGNNCSVEETSSSVYFIKKIIAGLYDKKIAEGIRVIYGGSVNSQNSTKYLKDGGLQGLLVGGDSLDAEDFIKIVTSAY